MAKFLFRKNHSTLSYSIYVALYWKPTIWGHRLGHNKKFLKWFQLFVHKYKYLTILSPFNSATFMWGFWIFNYLLRFDAIWLLALSEQTQKAHLPTSDHVQHWHFTQLPILCYISRIFFGHSIGHGKHTKNRPGQNKAPCDHSIDTGTNIWLRPQSDPRHCWKYKYKYKMINYKLYIFCYSKH